MSEAEVEHLRTLPSDRERLDYVIEDLEVAYFSDHKEYMAESDKAWDAMHRALSDGELTWDGGAYPLNHAVLAGELLYSEPDYIMSLKAPEQVRDIANALLDLDEQAFKRRYFAIDPEDYGGPVDDEDFAYTWDWFQNIRRLYTKAAAENRFVLFTSDQ